MRRQASACPFALASIIARTSSFGQHVVIAAGEIARVDRVGVDELDDADRAVTLRPRLGDLLRLDQDVLVLGVLILADDFAWLELTVNWASLWLAAALVASLVELVE